MRLSLLLILLFSVQRFAFAQDFTVDDYYKAYIATFSAHDFGMNVPKDQWKGYEILEKNVRTGYIKFKIKEMDLYIEMVVFQPAEEIAYLSFALVQKYYMNDFKCNISSLKAYTLNQTPLGSPLEEADIEMPWSQLYYTYYSKHATMYRSTTAKSDDKSDINNIRFVFPKNGEGKVLIQYSVPKIENGFVTEEMERDAEGRLVIKTPKDFKTFAELVFIKSEARMEFNEL